MVRAKTMKYVTYILSHGNHTRSINVDIKWFPLNPNYFKLNFDCSFTTNSDLCGYAEIILDTVGNWKVGYYNCNTPHYSLCSSASSCLHKGLKD